MLWTKKEIEILKTAAGVQEACDLLPHRSRASIKTKRSKLGLSSQSRWSEKEREILKQYYPNKEILLDKLNRTWDSIRSQAYFLELENDK